LGLEDLVFGWDPIAAQCPRRGQRVKEAWQLSDSTT
jgi:hypothetical protein